MCRLHTAELLAVTASALMPRSARQLKSTNLHHEHAEQNGAGVRHPGNHQGKLNFQSPPTYLTAPTPTHANPTALRSIHQAPRRPPTAMLANNKAKPRKGQRTGAHLSRRLRRQLSAGRTLHRRDCTARAVPQNSKYRTGLASARAPSDSVHCTPLPMTTPSR